jgi:hypothetical protein
VLVLPRQNRCLQLKPTVLGKLRRCIGYHLIAWNVPPEASVVFLILLVLLRGGARSKAVRPFCLIFLRRVDTNNYIGVGLHLISAYHLRRSSTVDD